MFGLIDLLYIKCFSIIFYFLFHLLLLDVFLQVVNNFNFLLSLVSLFFKLNRSTFLPERCGWFNVFWVINFVLKWLKKNQMYNLKAGI